MTRIAGAGLAGLLAAHAWPQAQVFERSAEPRASHRAVLRFRSSSVAKLIGIQFRPVTVRKGVWMNGRFVEPSIQLANLYSMKCLGGRLEAERSLWNLEPVQRFIAPENLYEQMVTAIGARIHWGESIDFAAEGPIISTAPLPITLEALSLPAPGEFHRQGIHVNRWRVFDADVFQTIYFPNPDTGIYRASITGNLLIIESVSPPHSGEFEQVMEAFGFSPEKANFLDSGAQRFGKIVPLADAARRALLLKLTQEHNIFSLGRFATWRNILLDDVVNDIDVVRRLMHSEHYHRHMFAAGAIPPNTI